MHETIGMISGLIVVLSVLPYAWRTYQRKIQPNLASWSVWTVLGLALLLTYRSSGAEANVWPAVFGFTNPLLVTLLAFWRGKRRSLNGLEKVCVAIGLAAIIMWWIVQDNQQMSAYALYIAIVADACAALPTIFFCWENPEEDRPFAWVAFGIGYGLAVFAVSESTFANYVLPVYMFLGATFVAIPLMRYRWCNRVPPREWI